MSERDRYVVAPGPDVDLDVEDIRLRDGTRLTNERADEIAEETLTIARGRPVLGGGTGGASPRVSFRIPEQVRRRAEEVAAAEDRTVSELAREALERYLAERG